MLLVTQDEGGTMIKILVLCTEPDIGLAQAWLEVFCSQLSTAGAWEGVAAPRGGAAGCGQVRGEAGVWSLFVVTTGVGE